MIATAREDDRCHVSYDRKNEWKQCCLKAMGFDDTQGETAKSASQVIQILNLMDDDTTMVEDEDDTSDHWMENANQISSSITQMANMIAKNRMPYVSGDLTEEEASVLESTVLSFSATAANQIDSLRAAIPPSSPDRVHHCAGIIASLMLRLREQVANPMASLQKQRTRVAMTIFQHPLACQLVLRKEEASGSPNDVWDQLVDDNDDEGAREQRFLPRHGAPAVSTDFMDKYTTSTEEEMSNLQRPPSLFQKKNREPLQPPPKQVKFDTRQQQKQEEERLMMYQNDVQVATQQELQHEAALLEVSLQNELDSVFQVEQTMTQITALLSQFSALVSEQQEEVSAIHQTAVVSKDNISKGQESLIDAKERTKRSKHYMATFVWSIAILLLLFNYIVP